MGITLQQEVLRFERVIGESDRSCQVEGRLTLPVGSPPLDRIQFCRARVRELRGVAFSGRVQVEGLLDVELNYCSPAVESEEMLLPDQLAVWSKETGGAIPFAQEVPLAGMAAGLPVDVSAEVGTASAEILDSSTVRCQIGLDLSVKATTPRDARLVTDITQSPADRLEVAKELLQVELSAGKAETEVGINTVLALPEIKPDLVRIIARAANLTELTVEVIRGRAIIGGRLEVNAVYVARTDDDGQGIEVGEWGGEGRTPIGFEAFIDLPGLSPDVKVMPAARLSRLNIEAIGPREVRLDTAAIVTAEAVRSRQVPVLTELIPGAEELVDLQRAQINVVHFVGRAAQEITVETTLELPPAKPAVERVLQTRVLPTALTAQAAEGKCLIDGWLDVSLLYQAEAAEGTQPVIAAVDWERHHGTGVPLTEVIELPEAGPGLDATLVWRLGRVSVEQVAPRTIRLVVAIAVEIKISEERTFSAITDAAVVPLAPIANRPSLLFYAAQPGDSLWDVARRYETTVEALVRTNKIADPETLEAGRKLLVPRTPVVV